MDCGKRMKNGRKLAVAVSRITTRKLQPSLWNYSKEIDIMMRNFSHFGLT